MKTVRNPKAISILLPAIIGFAAVTAVGFCFQAAGESRAPNVFLITMDTLRADHVGCYGDANIRTPALDALAADGTRFSNAFTASPITNPSHASILTGLLPDHDGVRDFGMPLAPTASPLAEVLKGSGYSTAAFIGSVILDSRGLAPGFDRGFDYYDHFPENLPQTASRYGRLERRALDVEHRAETWILGQGDAQPLFVWIHFYDPHDPYDPPEPYRSEYASRLYDGEIAYTDSALGRFVGFLKNRNLYDGSTIVVTGDHGEGLGDHGEETHGIFLYDSTLHVPLIVKLPSAARSTSGTRAGGGVVLSAQVRTVDIAPTILDLTGVHDSRTRDGASLRPLWTDTSADNTNTGATAPAQPSRVALAETDYPLEFGWAPLRSVRDDGKKYIEAPRPEFYDLGTDPGETRNIYEPWNPEVQRLRGIEAVLRKTEPSERAGIAGVNASKIAELKELGYLGSTPGSTTAPQPLLLPDPKDKIQVFNLLHSSMLATEEGKAAAVRSDLEKALQLDPKSAAVLTALGELDLEQGDDRRAADLLGRSLGLRPGDAGTAFDQARALFAGGDLRGAQARLNASGYLLADNYQALCLLGKIDAELKDWRKAEDPLQAAIILDSDRPDAYLELARVYIAEKKPDEALRQLDEARRLSPDSREIDELIARAQRAQAIAGRKSGKPTSNTKPSSP